MGDVHLLLDTVLGKKVMIALVVYGKAPIFFGDQLRRLEICDGWPSVTITTYDKGLPVGRLCGWWKDL